MKHSVAIHQSQNTCDIEFSSHLCEDQTHFYPLHFHKLFEIILVIKGTCELTVGERSYSLTKGKAAFILPFQTHSYKVGDDSCIRCTNVHEHIILTLSQFLKRKIPDSPVFHPEDSIFEFFSEQMQSMFGNDSGYLKRIEPPAKRIKTKGLLYTIESEFLSQRTFYESKEKELIYIEILQYISTNFRNNISLHDIAIAKGYNYQYLSRTFNKTLGLNFKKILNQYRVEYAHVLLQDTDLPITQIAFDSGFNSVRSFNQVCLETFKCSPKELRAKNIKNTNII